MKKYTVEFFGTFVLTLVVALSLAGYFSISTPILAVLNVGLFVSALGHISGSHINPAITIGLWSIKKISGVETLKYIISQFIGAWVSMIIFPLITQTTVPTNLVSPSYYTIALAEFAGMFIYGFFIVAFMKRSPEHLFGIFIAGSLLLGIAIASLFGSAGMINPAVAFGTGYFSFMYLIAPLVGSILGMNVYKYFDN
jgi:glycerol uptake facilitator protein